MITSSEPGVSPGTEKERYPKKIKSPTHRAIILRVFLSFPVEIDNPEIFILVLLATSTLLNIRGIQ